MTINTWVVEDDAVYRRMLKQLLDEDAGTRCDRVFPSCTQMLKAIETEPWPDLLLMDLGLPGMRGVEGIRKLQKVAPDITVVVLTVFEDKQRVLDSLNAGAAGYLLKTAAGPDIIKGLRQVFNGNAALSPAVAKVVLEEFRKPAPNEGYELSFRELEVLQCLSEGLSAKEIASELDITHRTVCFHLSNIYSKLEVQSQAGAVAKALRSGII